MCLYAVYDKVHSVGGATAHLSFGLDYAPVRFNNVIVGPHRWVRDSREYCARQWMFDGEIEEVDRATLFEHFFGPASELSMIPNDRLPSLEQVRMMWPSQFVVLRAAFENEFGLRPYLSRSVSGDHPYAALVAPPSFQAA
jgi:hypothetical protein